MATVSPPRRPGPRVPKDAKGPIPQPPAASDPFDDEPEAPEVPPSPAKAPSPASGPSPSPFDPDTEDDDDIPSGLDMGQMINEQQKAKILARKLPPFPTKIKFEDLIKIYKQLSNDQKDHLIAYVYRLEPKIDRKLVNPENDNYIDVLGTDEQFTLEYMINTHGGGKYHLYVNDTDIRKNGQLCSCLLEINKAQHEPLLNLEELDLTARENQAYVAKLKALGKLTSDGRVVKNPSAEKTRESNMAESITNRLLDRVLNPPPPPTPTNQPSETTAMLNFFLEKMKQDDPTKKLTEILGLVAALTPKPAPPPEDKTLQFLQLMEQQRQQYETKLAAMQAQMMELLTKQPEKPDLTTEITKLKELAETIGLGGGSGRTSVVDRIIETVGPAIPGIVNILASRMAPQQVPGTNPDGTPRMPNDLTNPTSLATAVPGLPGGTPEQEHMAFLDMVMSMTADDFVQAIANGVTGADAAQAVIDLKGMATYLRIIKDGPESIAAAMQRHPTFIRDVRRITTEEKMNQWILDFVSLGPDAGSETTTGQMQIKEKEKVN